MTIDITNMVEKIIFNEDQLLELKEALSKLGANKLNMKNVKSIILDQRTKIMEDIIDLLNFYMEQQPKQPEIIPSEELSVLHSKLTEREELLEEIGRRLERITGNSSNNSGTPEPEIRNFIIKELDAAQIPSWLEVSTLLDFETGMIIDDYKFLMWLVACVEKYYIYLFGEKKGISLPDKVKALNLPKKLEEDFLLIAHHRNANAHDIVKIPSGFLPIMKNGYLDLIKHFIHISLIPKIKNEFQIEGNFKVLDEIQRVIISQNPKQKSDLNLLLNIILKEGKF